MSSILMWSEGHKVKCEAVSKAGLFDSSAILKCGIFQNALAIVTSLSNG
jgi:hypothetical protein